MTFYELLVILHISAVIIWLGAGFLMAFQVWSAERAGDRAREGAVHQEMGRLAPTLFVPASISSFVLGVLLVIDGAWTFDQLWITLGMAGWLASFALGFFYFRPEGPRIGALVAERGPADPEVARRTRRLNVVDRLQVLTLFLVVADMVVKPTGDDTGFLVGLGAILALGVLGALLALRQPAAPTAPGGARS